MRGDLLGEVTRLRRCAETCKVSDECRSGRSRRGPRQRQTTLVRTNRAFNAQGESDSELRHLRKGPPRARGSFPLATTGKSKVDRNASRARIIYPKDFLFSFSIAAFSARGSGGRYRREKRQELPRKVRTFRTIAKPIRELICKWLGTAPCKAVRPSRTPDRRYKWRLILKISFSVATANKTSIEKVIGQIIHY